MIRLLLVLSVWLFIGPKGMAQSRPNFIIIYADDMGYGDVGINGSPNIKTPNLDKMAVEGIRFTNYYSASPACTASRYALLTGKYPSRSGFRWVLNPSDAIGIHPNEVTLAESLQNQGYHTAIFGKWHLGSIRAAFLPTSNGFQEYIGLPYSNDMIPPKYPDIALMNGLDTLGLNPDQTKLTKLYTDKAISFIARNQDTPFFIYLPYAMPHTPLFASSDFKGKSKRGLYGDVVEELDYHIGRLMQHLIDLGVDKNTYLIFTSDNGPWLTQGKDGGSAGLFRDGKGSTWEGGVREPFFIWGHRDLLKGRVEQSMFTAIDIYPSIMKLAGADHLAHKIDGQDYSDLWKKGGNGRSVFYYFGLNQELMAVRRGPWKLHVKTYSQLGIKHFEDKLPLLFNLDEDPSEKYNLANDYPSIVVELGKAIENMKIDVSTNGSFWD